MLLLTANLAALTLAASAATAAADDAAPDVDRPVARRGR